jgi:tetratricopeptide (TPR) repeat protein
MSASASPASPAPQPERGSSSAAPAPTAAPRWPTALLCLCAALAVYLPAALGARLLEFDDPFFFGPDAVLREGLGAVLDPGRPIANAWLPVAHASLWLDLRLGGGDAFVPHLHALLLHALAGFVLVRALLQLGVARAVAHVAGLLFLVHPAVAESVAWVSGRKDVLSGVFVFAALHHTAVFARRPGPWRAVGLAALGVLAMYSKPTAVVAPLLAALVCLLVRGPRARWLAPLVLLAVTAPIALHHQAIAAAEGTMAGGSGGGLAERLQQVPGACAHYLGTALWPLRLNVLYPEVQTLERFRGAFAAGACVLAALLGTALAAWGARRWRAVGFGLAAFAVALLPFNTAYPASSIAAADRYLYLALPGLALALVAAAARVHARAPAVLAVAVALPLAWLAGGRAHTFADDETLWTTSLATDADNAVAHVNLATARLRAGPAAIDRVRPHLEAAAKAARYPIHELRARQLLVSIAVADADYARAATEAKAAIAAAEAQLARETTDKRRNEATALLRQALLAAFEPLQLVGDDAGADAVYEAAKRLAPEHPDVIAFGAMRALAACRGELQALADAGKPPFLAADDPRAVAAEAALTAALARAPRHAGLSCALAEWARARDEAMVALRHYQRAQHADAACVTAWLGAARLCREREMWESAEKYARDGLLARQDPALRQELALALVGQGKLADAELHLEAYMRTRPDDKDTAKVLANVLVGRAAVQLGDGTDRAQVYRTVERALAYHPNDPKASLVLGRLAKEERRHGDAVRYLERAYRGMPGYADARLLYADALAASGYDRLLARDDDGAATAWRKCLDVAPEGFATREIEQQLERVWKRWENDGVAALQAGDRAAAAATFRKCLAILPEQHWAAWLLATALHDTPDADLAEIERLCRVAIAWQRRHQLDQSKQVLLLATTLARAGRPDDARSVAAEYLAAPQPDAKPQVLTALQRLAGG